MAVRSRRRSLGEVALIATLVAAVSPSCRRPGGADAAVVGEERALEVWLSSAGARVHPAAAPSLTRVSRERTWSGASARPWREYQRSLLDRPPPGYPSCTRGPLTISCKRELPGDVFVVEIESPGEDAREFVARFRATSY